MPIETKETEVITASRDVFKGYPMLVLSARPDEKYPFRFGLVKAKRILACIEDIKKFVQDAEAAKSMEG